jgi:Zn-finger nucleic acid-binding protein
MAKCSHCSAPLPKSGIICEYCGVRNDIDLTDEKKVVNAYFDLDRECPICHIPLKTIDVGEIFPFYIERCESCYGLFFDVSELEDMIEHSVKGSKNVDLIKLAQITENPRYVDIMAYRKCPVCKETMQRQNFMRRSGVITDVCSEHGVWLDSGELRHILEWIKVGGESKVEGSQEMRKTTYKRSEPSTSKSVSNAELGSSRAIDVFDAFLDYFFDIPY